MNPWQCDPKVKLTVSATGSHDAPSVAAPPEERDREARCAAANGSTLSGALRKLADSLDQLDKMFESTPKPGGPAQTLREAATQLDEADAYIGALEDVCDSDQLARAQSLSNEKAQTRSP